MNKKSKFENYEKQKNGGITLIALVVTIVVLLILAGVSITTITGQSGIFNMASQSKIENIHAEVYEALTLKTQTYKIERLTGVVSVSLIEYLQEQEILSSNYEINVEKLVGKKLPLGKGTNGVNDIYKLEKVIESAKIGSLNKVLIAETTQSEQVRYKLVYYGQEVDNATQAIILGYISLDKKEALEDYAEIFEYEDSARTILKGIKKEFIKSYNKKNTGSKKDGERNEVYKDGKQIRELRIPSNVTTISDKAFFCYPYLTITLPSSVKKIGAQAFYDCEEVYVEGKSSAARFDEVGENAFVQTPVIYSEEPEVDYANLFIYKNGDKSIIEGINTQFIKEIEQEGKNYPVKCIFNKYGEEIREIRIPDGVVEIGEKGFFEYLHLKITLPSSVEKIGAQAFYNCSILNIEGKSSVVHFDEVGENAFIKTTVIYLAKPTVDYDDLFIYKDGDKSVIEGINTQFITKGLSIFKKQNVNIIVNEYGEEIREITIPDGVVEIGAKVFFEYPNLTINIPESVMKIGAYSFYDCRHINILEKTTYQDFTSVGHNAFTNSGVKFIDNN